MNTGIKVEFCIMKRLKEKSLPPFFSQGTNHFVSRQPPSCYRSWSSFSRGDSEECLLAFPDCAECFLIHALCVGGQEGSRSGLLWSPSLSGSDLLGQEPWEAGGLNNEEPEPSDLAGPPRLSCHLFREALFP